jgi:hypothetical protein
MNCGAPRRLERKWRPAFNNPLSERREPSSLVARTARAVTSRIR